MKRLPFACVVLSLLAGVGALPGHAAPPGDTAEALMKRKLVEAQRVLEGLALQDFDKVARSADELGEISKMAQWKVLKTPAYETFSAEFRDKTADLAQAARKKNVDAATLAYVEMTLTCVKCHKHVRDKRMTRRD